MTKEKKNFNNCLFELVTPVWTVKCHFEGSSFCVWCFFPLKKVPGVALGKEHSECCWLYWKSNASLSISGRKTCKNLLSSKLQKKKECWVKFHIAISILLLQVKVWLGCWKCERSDLGESTVPRDILYLDPS